MEKVKPSNNLKEITILYVEDEKQIREVFVMLLKKHVKHIYTATNGQEGLEIYQNHKPDVVITDIRMPVMDGIKMAQQIKQINKEAYIIFITAFSDIEYLKKALEIGVEGYITKPVDRNTLYKKLNFLAEGIVNKRKILEYLEILKNLLNEYDDPVVLIERNTIKIYNKAFIEIFGETNTVDELKDKLALSGDCQLLDLAVDKEIVCVNKDEEEIYYEVSIKNINKYKVLYFSDITKYRQEILIDGLTQVYNRKYLHILEKENVGKITTVIMCDIDNFKRINDTYGHQTGDKVLKQIAQTFRNLLRKTDVVIRYGGEEFLIHLDGVENPETAYKIAEQLREKVHSIKVEGKPISCSFGVSIKKLNKKQDLKTLIQEADQALYKAKKTGKDKTEIFFNGKVVE